MSNPRILVSTDKVSNLNKSVEELREMFTNLANPQNIEELKKIVDDLESQTDITLKNHTEAINQINENMFYIKNDVEEIKKFIDNLTTALGTSNKVSLKITNKQ